MKLAVVNEPDDIDKLIRQRIADQGFVMVERSLISELSAVDIPDARALWLVRKIVYNPEIDAYALRKGG